MVSEGTMTTSQVNHGNGAVVGDWEVGFLRARWGATSVGVGSSFVEPLKFDPPGASVHECVWPTHFPEVLATEPLA